MRLIENNLVKMRLLRFSIFSEMTVLRNFISQRARIVRESKSPALAEILEADEIDYQRFKQ